MLVTPDSRTTFIKKHEAPLRLFFSLLLLLLLLLLLPLLILILILLSSLLFISAYNEGIL